MTEGTTVPLSAPPKEDQLVEHDGKIYKTIKEGLAYILIPPNTSTQQNPQKSASSTTDEQHQRVFYNPIQQFNRDLSVLAIKAFGEDLIERRRGKWEKEQERLATKKEKQREKKRKRQGDVPDGEPVKIQRLGDELEGETAFQPAVQDNVNATATAIHTNGLTDPAQVTADTANVQGEPTAVDASNPVTKPAKKVPPFRILDALSATGLRALRYAQEIPFATSITANDLESRAVKSIEMHVKHNNQSAKIHPNTSDALAHMYTVAHPPLHSHGPAHVSHKYDVIDLDPYGTAAPFIDAALQALNDGGLLCVTCTDSAVWASCGYSEKTFALYGGLPVKGNHCHEVGLRLIAHSVATTAARHGMAIEPLLSLSIDYYCRLFIRVRRSPADVKFLAGKTMLSYECDNGCGASTTQLLGRNSKQDSKNIAWKYGLAQGPSCSANCEHCGSKTHMAGPMWAGPLHHPGFIEKILESVKTVDKTTYATTDRITGMLTTAMEELIDIEYVPEPAAPNTTIPRMAPESIDHMPFFFIPSATAKAMHCQAPPEAAIKGALRHAGFRATRSHCKAGSVKTNAPWTAIWEIFREWIKQRAPIKVEKVRTGGPAWHLLRLGEVAAAEPPEVAKSDDAPMVDAPMQTEDVPTPESAQNGDQVKTNGTTRKFKVVFDEALGRDAPGKKLVRYQANPRENWGPLAKAK